jgi:hypothetical protein
MWRPASEYAQPWMPLPGLPAVTRSDLIAELAANNPHLRQAGAARLRRLHRQAAKSADRTHSRACALSVMPGNNRRSSTPNIVGARETRYGRLPVRSCQEAGGALTTAAGSRASYFFTLITNSFHSSAPAASGVKRAPPRTSRPPWHPQTSPNRRPQRLGPREKRLLYPRVSPFRLL